MDEIELDVAPFRDLCSLGPVPYLVTGFLRLWMTSHFSRSTQIEFPELRSLLWRETDTTKGLDSSSILIESITRWLPSRTEKKPAILISRGDWQVQRLGINDVLMGYPALDGREHFEVVLQGSHTLFCLSTNPVEAELLSMEVARELYQFGPAIRQELVLKRFLLMGGGKLFRVREAKENYAVPVTVAWAASDAWVLFEHAPFLKTISISEFVP